MRDFWPLLERLKETMSTKDKASLLDGLCYYQMSHGELCEMTPQARMAMLAISQFLAPSKRGNPNFKKGETNPYRSLKKRDANNCTELLPIITNGDLLPFDMDETSAQSELSAPKLMVVPETVSAMAPAPEKPAKPKNPQTAHYRAFLAQIEDERMREVLTQWLVYKVERREYYKPMGLKSCYTTLMKMSGGDPVLAEEIVTFTAGSHYQGFVMPRDYKPQAASQPQQASKAQENYDSRTESARLINNLMNNGEL